MCKNFFFLNLCHVLPREPGNTRVLNSDEVKGIKTNMKMKLETKKKAGVQTKRCRKGEEKSNFEGREGCHGRPGWVLTLLLALIPHLCELSFGNEAVTVFSFPFPTLWLNQKPHVHTLTCSHTQKDRENHSGFWIHSRVAGTDSYNLTLSPRRVIIVYI